MHDLAQCEAEKPNLKYNPFGLGHGLDSSQRMLRCTPKPTYIATEVKPGPDGEIRTMSLCDDCKKVCERDLKGLVAFAPIPEAK